MDILSAMLKVRSIQESITVANPSQSGNDIKVLKAWLTRPPQKVVLTDFPCFINSWTFNGETRQSILREQSYSVHMQLLINDADWDRAALIATAFMPAIVKAFDTNVTLDTTVVRTTLRGGNPTLGAVTLDKTYIGLDLYLDLSMADTADFTA